MKVCKYNEIGIEVLSRVLYLTRQNFENENKFKEFLSLQNKDGISARDYCLKNKSYLHLISEHVD
jgi:hypothetical protein